ncbi:hypothetical protein MRX96_021143 [Rhipicephalus microplus]
MNQTDAQHCCGHVTAANNHIRITCEHQPFTSPHRDTHTAAKLVQNHHTPVATMAHLTRRFATNTMTRTHTYTTKILKKHPHAHFTNTSAQERFFLVMIETHTVSLAFFRRHRCH